MRFYYVIMTTRKDPYGIVIMNVISANNECNKCVQTMEYNWPYLGYPGSLLLPSYVHYTVTYAWNTL